MRQLTSRGLEPAGWHLGHPTGRSAGKLSEIEISTRQTFLSRNLSAACSLQKLASVRRTPLPYARAVTNHKTALTPMAKEDKALNI